MTQNDFNSAFAQSLLHDGYAGIRPEEIAAEVFRRDQFRARVYAQLSLFFWLLGTAGMFVLVYGLNRLVLSMRIASVRHPTTAPLTGFDEQISNWGTSFIHHSMPYVGGGVIALLLAALFTVLYVSSSRQATLARINISLMQMSEELKRMRPQ